jgi:Tfp pilus assembly protein PilZ
MADKRDTKRRIKRLPVTFLYGAEVHRGTSSNLSLSGLFIRTRKSIKTGLHIQMVLEISEDLKIPLRGITVREKKKGYRNPYCGIGVSLTEVPQAYRDYIKAFTEIDT